MLSVSEGYMHIYSEVKTTVEGEVLLEDGTVFEAKSWGYCPPGFMVLIDVDRNPRKAKIFHGETGSYESTIDIKITTYSLATAVEMAGEQI